MTASASSVAGAFAGLAVPHQLDPQEEPEPAHVADQRVPRLPSRSSAPSA